MRYLSFNSILLALLGALPLHASASAISEYLADFAQARAEGRVAHVLEIDNDTLLLNRNDGFYSSGLQYTQAYSVGASNGEATYGWRVGQQLYTASDIKLPPQQVGPPDHPYAGWLYAGLFKIQRRSDGAHVAFGIDVGCLGPCAGGEWTQTNFHRIINQPLPQAWSKQVKTEPGVVLYADVAPGRWTPHPSFDVTPSVNARFGNIHTDVGVSAIVRAGLLNTLPGRPTLHGFLRADLRAVAYNATLQGGYFSENNPHTVQPERLVPEAEAGISWRNHAYGARISLVRRGNEIRNLPDSIGAQNFVRLQFSYTP